MIKATKIIYAIAFLTLPSIAYAQAAPAMKSAKRAEMKEEHKEGMKEAHPELHAAMKALERSRKDLQKAASDYGGHKAEAIKSIDEAIKHLKLAEEYDKK